ncbi:MAG: hypothetical protein IPK25_14385 [Saprospiraceae bacterium]|nr:hypothetical protein [Saprospiraceae bacterium]
MTQQEMLKIPVRLIMTTDLFVANKDTILKEINIIVERKIFTTFLLLIMIINL